MYQDSVVRNEKSQTREFFPSEPGGGFVCQQRAQRIGERERFQVAKRYQRSFQMAALLVGTRVRHPSRW